MGIKGLSQLLADNAPGCIREFELKSYFGRKVAIDASMAIYQFLIAIRMGADGQLTNEAGNTTSHLQGLFYRTTRIMEMGVKPVYVFDGKPPELKSGELLKRKERAAEAAEALAQSKEAGVAEDIEKFSKRTVRATRDQMDECRRLLRLMGVPYIDAPCEAEAQCAEMCKAGLVYGTASDDMDTLTHKCPVLLRNFLSTEQRKLPVREFHIEEALKELDMPMEKFIDLCILCGCDYMDTIRGIGPKTALNLMRKYKTLEDALQSLDSKKYKIPDDFYEKLPEVRKLFTEPDVISPKDLPELKWGEVDTEGIIQFLCDENQFDPSRIRVGIERLKKSRGKSTQGRMEDFFGAAKFIKRKKTEKPAAKGKAPKFTIKKK